MSTLPGLPEGMRFDEWRRAVTSAVQELGFSEDVQAAFLAAVFECHAGYHAKWAQLTKERDAAEKRGDEQHRELTELRHAVDHVIACGSTCNDCNRLLKTARGKGL
jgi:hypothetical protein